MRAGKDCGWTSWVGEGPGEKWADPRDSQKVKLIGLGNLLDQGFENDSLWPQSGPMPSLVNFSWHTCTLQWQS